MPAQLSINMLNVPSFRFQQCLGPFTMLLVQGYSAAVLFYIYLTTFLEVRNFGNTLAMSAIFFFWICSKFHLDFKNSEKNCEKVYCFWDICIWIGWSKYWLLRTEYLPWAVNVLTNDLKILHITKSDFFKFNCLGSNQ